MGQNWMRPDILEEGLSRHLCGVSDIPRRGHHGENRVLTAHAPAIEATMPPEIIIGLMPRVLLNSIPLKAPAATLLAASCLPRA